MPLTNNEQYLLELINRARLDPLAEAQRYGLSDLNSGLAPGTISASAKQVLAPNEYLNSAARSHSQWMLDEDKFSHTGAGGSDPGGRMTSAGYIFSGAWTWGENISWTGSTGTLNFNAQIDAHHSGLFLSAGHRANILKDDFREVGLSQLAGKFTTYNASMLTEDFGKSGTSVFLTGVVYSDNDHDDFYSIGEGVAGTTISIAGGGSTTSSATGGHTLDTTAGVKTVTMSGKTFSVDLSGGNGKIDLVDGTLIKSSVSLSLISGVSKAALLGVADLALTGSAGAETLTGNRGNNTIEGGGGNDQIEGGDGFDTAVFSGNFASYLVTYSQVTYLFTISGASTGTDTVVGVESFKFADQTKSASALQSSASPPDTTVPTIAISTNDTNLTVGETATITFTLSEASTNFIASDVTVSGGVLANFTGSGTSYSATFTPASASTANGVVSVASGKFTDAANNANADGADANNTVTMTINTLVADTTAPTIAISTSDANLTAGETATITFTLTEASTNFTASDVTVSGGVLSNFTGSGANYTATFTPTAASTTNGVVSVASGKFTDAASNANADGSDANNTVTMLVNTVVAPDTTAPTIAISSSDLNLTTGEIANITFTLSEASTNFIASDVTVSGGVLSNFTGSGASYSATFTPSSASTTNGLVSVASGKFTDAANNANADGADANNTVTMTVDTTVVADITAPTIAISTSDIDLTTGETANITFTLSEASTNFIASDVTVSGGALSNFTGSGTSYTATFTPASASTANGVVSVASGKFTDAANNANADGVEANNTVTMTVNTLVADTTAPTIAISTSDNVLTTGETATITFTLSEASTNFTAADVSVSGGALSNFTGSGASYTAIFTPTAASTASGVVSVASGKFTDAAGNANADGLDANNTVGMTINTKVADTTAPTIAISTSDIDLTTGETANITFTLSEASTNFIASDVTVSGGTLSAFTGSGTSYTATFTPANSSTANGVVSVASGKFTDAANNANADGADANNKVTMSVNTGARDTTRPTIAISTSDANLTTGETATITFTLSEASTNFIASDVRVTGGTLSNFTGSGTSYSAIFTPANASTINGVVSVASVKFTDAANNANADGFDVNNSVTMTVNTLAAADTTAPTIAVSTSDASLTAGETATITFTLSEASTNFIASDVTVSGGTLSAFAGSGASYSATFTPASGSTSNGAVSVASNKFTDAANNANTDGADSNNTVAMTVNTMPLPGLTLTGIAVADTLAGGAGADLISGMAGNDHLMGNAGNDTLDGGAGRDTAEYGSRQAAYTIVATPGGFSVTGPDGADSLVNIERLQFQDADLAFDIDGNAGQVYRLYQAAFNRTPDLAGLGGWIAAMDNGAPLLQIASSFMASPEFQSLYGANPSNADFVANLYTNALHRPSGQDAASAAGWVSQLESGQVSRAQALVSFSESAENKASVLPAIANGITYATADQAAGPARGQLWSGTSGADKLIGSVGNDTFNGGAGNDFIEGGKGLDTAVFGGTRASHAISHSGNAPETVLIVSGASDGTDTLRHVERIQFSDVVLAFDTDGNAGQTYRLYQAAFNRTPDKPGLTDWVHGMDNGLTLTQVAHGFIASAEFQGQYGANPSNATFINLLYNNVLHRAADQGGADYWNDQLGSGVTKEQVLIGFSESAENQIALIGVIQGGIELAL